MFRKLGLLAVACLMVLTAQAAQASDTLITPTTTAMDVDAPAPAPAPGAAPAKNEGMKPRPYAIELQKKLDPRTGQTKEENPTFIKTGDAAIVKVKPTKPMVIENVKELPQLGRFAIRDMGTTIAAGMCIAIQAKQMR